MLRAGGKAKQTRVLLILSLREAYSNGPSTKYPEVKCWGRSEGTSACLRDAFSQCFARHQWVFWSSVWFLRGV